ncbi:MAG: hypothetical protein GC160_24195 [Acidobacteria bacterium]|nr:hypothetical protein [Acidobacteriota bacterium]
MIESVEAPPESVITIPNGLPGLPQMERSVLLRPEDLDPILLLQSLSDASVSLPVVPARAISPDYHPTLAPEDRRALGLPEDGPSPELLELVVLVLDSQEGVAACNLFAPILVHPLTRIGRQCLQLGSDYPSLLRLEGL